MARAVLGPLLTDLRGKLGNQVFDNYKGVHIVRAMPSVITNPQSARQHIARTALAVFVQAWRGLSLVDKGLWVQVGCEFIKGQESNARMNRGGLIQLPRGPFSGYNAFIALNMNRYMSGYSTLTDVLTDAPIGKELPESLKSFSAVVDGRVIRASWEYITPGPLQERLEIWIKSTTSGVHPQLIYTEARNADGNTDISVVRKTSGIDVDLPNGVYQVQAMIVNKYGLTTQPSELVFVQIGDVDVFTYFATRQLGFELLGIVAVSGPDVIDLSSIIPAGAHSIIVANQVEQTVVGTTGRCRLILDKDATQGFSFRVYKDRGVFVPSYEDEEGIMGITTARTIQRSIEYTGDATYEARMWILGYVS